LGFVLYHSFPRYFSPQFAHTFGGKYQGSEASLSSAQAEADKAALEATATIEGVNTDVARLQADLATAEFNLSETIVRAPTDGTVLQLFLRNGMMAVPLPLRPVMVFQHDELSVLVASFLQNSTQRVEEGSEAEVILPAVPRRRSLHSRRPAPALWHIGFSRKH
jgi:multidrug resistance efflux pump